MKQMNIFLLIDIMSLDTSTLNNAGVLLVLVEELITNCSMRALPSHGKNLIDFFNNNYIVAVGLCVLFFINIYIILKT